MRDKKWIVVKSNGKNRFRCGFVNCHKDLAVEGEKVIGGGLFEFDEYSKSIKLYGQSTDFGWVYELSTMESCKDGMVEAFKSFCEDRNLSDIDVSTWAIVWNDYLWEKHVLKEKA